MKDLYRSLLWVLMFLNRDKLWWSLWGKCLWLKVNVSVSICVGVFIMVTFGTAYEMVHSVEGLFWGNWKVIFVYYVPELSHV